MKNNSKRNKEINKNKVDSIKSQNQNLLYKSHNDKKKNKIDLNNINNIENQELSDIKSIVKNSVEKIYDLFSLQEMKNSSKIISKNSNDINFNELNDKNETKKGKQYNDINNNSPKEDKKYMKTNITFKINNYLSVLNKNKNTPTNELNNGTTNTIEDENSYLQKKLKKKVQIENSMKSSNTVYNLKKNKKKELINNNSSNSNCIKNKTDIKIKPLKNNKKEKIINNVDKDDDYLLLTQKKNPSKYRINDYNSLNEDLKNQNEESNINITDKSIIVNTKNNKKEISKNNYIIKPTRISHINKESIVTITNEEIINQSKEIKNIYNSKNNSQKKKKYMFLKRTNRKNNGETEEEKKKKKMIFSQKKSKTKYELTNSNSRLKNNLYSTRNEFYLNKKNDNYMKENNLKKNNLNTNASNKMKKNNISSNNKKNKTIKENINNYTKNKYNELSNNLLSMNNLLFSNTPHNYLSQKCQSENKLRFLENDFINVSRNKNRELSSSRINKESKIIDMEAKNIFNSENKKIKKEERKKIRNTLKKLYDKEFPNKVYTNDIIKLFLLLNEYIINNNLLYDYNSNNNRNILNQISQTLSKYSSIDYPKEFDINIDNYINNIKLIQRSWRKYKIKKLIGKNEEIHELKKIVVNRYITKSGYKMKKIIGLFNSLIEDFNDIKNSNEINRMFYYIKHLIKRDLTTYEKNLIYKEFINDFK